MSSRMRFPGADRLRQALRGRASRPQAPAAVEDEIPPPWEPSPGEAPPDLSYLNLAIDETAPPSDEDDVRPLD